jgi:tetratricopeptide (TPR) repeat protein
MTFHDSTEHAAPSMPGASGPAASSSIEAMLQTLRATAERLEAAVPLAHGGTARAALKDEIVGLFRQAEALERDAQSLKARAKALAGQWRAAEPATARVGTSARVDHLGASTFVEKGWSRLALGEASAAVDALRKALELAPGDDHAETLLAWAYLEADEPAQAALHLHHVLLREPQAALARACVGYAALRAGAYGEAIAHLSRVVRQSGDATAILYAHLWLGQVYLEREMLADAQTCFRRALELGPNLLQASWELGRAQWFAGDQLAARETWRAAAASNTFNPWGKRCAESVAAAERGEGPPRGRPGGGRA